MPKNETEAWCKFQSQNPKCFDATTLGAESRANEFLHNRLYKCFLAGVVAGQLLEQEKVKQRLSELLFK